MARANISNANKRKIKLNGSNRSNSEVEPASVSYEKSTSFLKRASSRRFSADVSIRGTLDRILTKGIVIDAWISVAVMGLRLVDIEAEVTVTSLETYLRYADAIGTTGVAAVPITAIPIAAVVA